jgi:hypothetical protein
MIIAIDHSYNIFLIICHVDMIALYGTNYVVSVS